MDIATEAADGHRWVTQVWPAEAASSALFWIPALGVPASKYARWAQALAAKGITVAVHEWRGNGSSSLRPTRRCDWGYQELIEVDMPASVAAAKAVAPGLTWVIGGHSLGGQLAALAAGLTPSAYAGLVLVATGVPDFRLFPLKQRLAVQAFVSIVPAITRVFGTFPGDHLQWAGREAATLMREWAQTARRGNYRGVALSRDAEAAMADWRGPVLGLQFTDDWLAPTASLDGLIAKLGTGSRQREIFNRTRLGDTPDHFRWMKSPDAVATVVSAWSRAQFL